MNEREALLLGIMLGDGCVGIYNKFQYRTQVTGHSIDDKEFFLEVIKPLFMEIFNKNVKIYERKKCKAIDLVVYSKEIVNKINNEWEIQLGKKKEIYISNKILNNSELMKKIVCGFFATDGSLVITNNNKTIYPRIEFQNTSEKILKQIQYFLFALGLKGGLYKMDREHYGGTVYRLQYNGKKNLLKFEKEIGFINPKHEMKFEEFKIERLG